MQIDINLNPKIKIRPKRFYVALVLLLVACLIWATLFYVYWSQKRELIAIQQKLGDVQLEQEMLKEELERLHSGVNESNYQLRYFHLIDSLESLYLFSIDEMARQMRGQLPVGARLKQLQLDTGGNGYLEANLSELKEAARYLESLAQLPFIESCHLSSIAKEAEGYLAVYQLSVKVLRSES